LNNQTFKSTPFYTNDLTTTSIVFVGMAEAANFNYVLVTSINLNLIAPASAAASALLLSAKPHI